MSPTRFEKLVFNPSLFFLWLVLTSCSLIIFHSIAVKERALFGAADEPSVLVRYLVFVFFDVLVFIKPSILCRRRHSLVQPPSGCCGSDRWAGAGGGGISNDTARASEGFRDRARLGYNDPILEDMLKGDFDAFGEFGDCEMRQGVSGEHQLLKLSKVGLCVFL
jgi:hypothetical protein